MKKCDLLNNHVGLIGRLQLINLFKQKFIIYLKRLRRGLMFILVHTISKSL